MGETSRKAAGDPAWHCFLDVMLAHKEQFLAALAPFELNAAQAFLLRALGPGTALPMCRIASALACDASNVTNLVDRLEVRGLIERQADPSDRRVRNIVLTRAGTRLRQQLFETALAPPPSFLTLTPAELEQFRTLLQKILMAHGALEDCEDTE